MNNSTLPPKKSPRSPRGDPLIVLPEELHANLHKLVDGNQLDLREYIAQILQSHLDAVMTPEGVLRADMTQNATVGDTRNDPQDSLDRLGNSLRAELDAQLSGIRHQLNEQTEVIKKLAEQQKQTYDLLSVLVDALDDEYEEEEEEEEEDTTGRVTVL
jgi:hypothetical protein